MQRFGWHQLVLALIGVSGTLAFALVLVATYYTPEWVERFAADFIEQKARERVGSVIDDLAAPAADESLTQLASELASDKAEKLERHREQLRRDVDERIASALAEIRDLDCPCRAKWEDWIEQGIRAQIDLLAADKAAINDFIQASYANVVAELKRDIRIFAGTNTAVFVLFVLVAALKPRASWQLFVPGLLLLLSTVACSYLYIVEQDWLLTIIYNDYTGFSYVGYLSLVFAALCDIVLNRARITTLIVNWVLSMLGAVANATPC